MLPKRRHCFRSRCPPSTYTGSDLFQRPPAKKTRSAMRTRPRMRSWPRSCSGRCSAFLVVVSLVSSRLRKCGLICGSGVLSDAADSATIQMMASCMNWAKDCRRRASGQVPSPIEPFEPSELAAGLCDRGHSPSARQRADPGVVRRPLRGRNS